MTRAYYNEHDPFAAEWLKILIVCGYIAEGDVDTRSIEDVRPNDLAGYTQCHFFAGIGGWSHALRLAGWPDSRPVWTGSCPCQPFSAAGKGIGIADERHLWPAFHWLIANCRPVTVFGEQVASKAGLAWLDIVQTDLENTGYAVGASDLCAAGVGAPHIRQRLYFTANSQCTKRRKILESRNDERDGGNFRRPETYGELGTRCEISNGVGSNSIGTRLQEQLLNRRISIKTMESSERETFIRRGYTRGFWNECDWWHGRDEKFRPIRAIESHVQLLANGISDIMGSVSTSIQEKAEMRLLAYGTYCQKSPGEAMFDVWSTAYENAIQWSLGGFNVLPKAQILLAFLCQLSKQRGFIEKGFSFEGAQISEERMRSLRRYSQSTCSSCGRGLYEQCENKSPNPLHILSSILALYAHEAWGETVYAYARYAGPLAPKHIGRVGRLRGYGNAIVPQVAAEFIKASEGI